MKLKNDVWIIIPGYNEANNIGKVIDQVRKFSSNIVVVDDGSSDTTYETAKKYTNHVLKHIVNVGKGAALLTAMEFLKTQNVGKVVLIDSDGQHNPADIPKFVEKLESYDIVFGVRRINKRMPIVLRLGNFVISQITFLLHGIKLEDTQCGFRAFRYSVWPKLKWKSTDYGVESEMIANVGKHRLRYAVIPVDTVYLDRHKGTTVIDGVRIVFQMVWRKMRG